MGSKVLWKHKDPFTDGGFTNEIRFPASWFHKYKQTINYKIQSFLLRQINAKLDLPLLENKIANFFQTPSSSR